LNTADARIALRARGPLETFDVALLFVGASWRPLARLAAVSIGPPVVAFTVLCWLTEGHPALLLLVLPLLDPLQVPATLLGARLLFEPAARVGEAMRASVGWASLQFIVLRWFVACLALPSVGLSLLLVPSWHFVGETLLLERVGLRRAPRRSGRLGTREPLHLLAGVTSRVVLTGWCALVAESGAQAILATGLQLGRPFGAVLDGQVTPFVVAGILVAQPLHAVYRLLLYLDVRTLAEGWDLQATFWQVARREES
jgi:hypothetical protein